MVTLKIPGNDFSHSPHLKNVPAYKNWGLCTSCKLIVNKTSFIETHINLMIIYV